MRRARQLRRVQIALTLVGVPLAFLSASAFISCLGLLVLVSFMREGMLEHEIRSSGLALALFRKEAVERRDAKAERHLGDLPPEPFGKFPDEWLRGLASAISLAEGEGAFGTNEDRRLKRALVVECERRSLQFRPAHNRDPWSPVEIKPKLRKRRDLRLEDLPDYD